MGEGGLSGISSAPEAAWGAAAEPRAKLGVLMDVDELQRMQDSFSEATGLASLICFPDGSSMTRPSGFSRLCSELMRGSELGVRNCVCSDSVALSVKRGSSPTVQTCLNGCLWCGYAGIFVGSRHVATWIAGQMRCEDGSLEAALACAREAGVDLEAFSKAFEEIPTMSREQFSKHCDALFVFARQVSELAWKNFALRQSERDMKTTLDSIGDAVISTDAFGHVARMNPVAESLTGWSLAEARGRPLEEVFNPVDMHGGESLSGRLAELLLLQSPELLPPNSILVSKDGAERIVSASASPIQGQEGKPSGLVIVFRDITERRMLDEQLRLGQRMDAIGRLAGGVAHDFNNMLGGILGPAELLMKKLESDREAKLLAAMIVEAGNKALSFSDKLIDFSRKGAASSELIDAHELLRGVVDAIPRHSRAFVSVSCSLQAQRSCLLGDAEQLRRCFLNLISVMIDSMPDGGDLEISSGAVSLSEEEFHRLAPESLGGGDYLKLSFAQTGASLAKVDRGRIFEPFLYVNSLGKDMGLGLAAVYGAVKGHKGAINLWSRRGGGVAFKIYLPLHGSSSPRAASAGAGAQGQDSCSIGRILLVDDDPMVRCVGKMLLEELGNEVDTAQDGLDALETISWDKRFDLVFMDVQMPRMNGCDAYRAITRLAPELRFIFTSGFTFEHDMESLLAQPNVIDFVQKPYKLSTLAKALSKLQARTPSA